jgi:outer membrane protein TolC
MSKFCLAPLISILALSGCVSIPALEQHSITNITAPTLGDTNSGFKDISAIDNMNAQNNEWWKKFNDGQLDKLMNQVISNNIDLNIAKLNIDKVALLINNSQTYKSPQVNTTATVERQKLASNAFYPPPLAGSLINFSQVGVNATYNVDLFNKLSNEINSQSLQKESLILKKRALVFSLSVQTFKLYGYWQYLLTQKQLFQEQKNTYSNLLSLTEKKISLGLGQQ